MTKPNIKSQLSKLYLQHNNDYFTSKTTVKKDDILIRNIHQLRSVQFDKLKPRTLFHHKPPSYNPLQRLYSNTFDNQKHFAKQIILAHDNNPLLTHTLAIAPTQSGKTGSMLATIHDFINHPTLSMPTHNIFIFTPHSSREWLQQTRLRFPKSFQPQIIHRNLFHILLNKLHNIQNALIIIDEVHIGAKISQTLHKLFNHLNAYNPQHLLDNNIKLIYFTATPDNLIHSISNFRNTQTTIHMLLPINYVSIHTLLRNNQIRNLHDICGFDPITNNVHHDVFTHLKSLIPIIQSFSSPKYHIIRTPRAHKHFIVLRNFKSSFAHLNATFISEPTQHFDFELLATPPKLHTFIFILDKLRCAKTIHKPHLGILYDRYTKSKPNPSSVLQGLAGRLTGYHNNTHAIVFTHINSLHLSSHKSNHPIDFFI